MTQFDLLYEQVLGHFLVEGLDASFLRKKHSEAKVIAKDTNITQKKMKLKQLAKELMIHILNANYKGILTNYFPNLVNIAGKVSDNDFKAHLDRELSTTGMTSEEYDVFLRDIDKIIFELGHRGPTQLDGLLNLRTSFLLRYKG